MIGNFSNIEFKYFERMSGFEGANSFNEDVTSFFKRGDREAFGEFYDKCAPVLYGMICTMIKEQVRSENVLAKSLMQIWDNRLTYDISNRSALLWMLRQTRVIANAQVDDLDNSDYLPVPDMVNHNNPNEA